jgi:lipid-A-disaccharide synthase
LHAYTPVLAVLPGSRTGEVARLGDAFLQAAKIVAESVPYLQVVVPAANAECRAALAPMIANTAFNQQPPTLLDGRAREAMVAADVVLLASGTATLEAMLAKRAMVVGYKVSPLTYRIVKTLGMLKVDRYALPNVLAGTDLAPELMQEECTPQNLAAAVLNLFQHPDSVGGLQPTYRQLHETLRKDASANAANAIAKFIR